MLMESLLLTLLGAGPMPGGRQRLCEWGVLTPALLFPCCWGPGYAFPPPRQWADLDGLDVVQLSPFSGFSSVVKPSNMRNNLPVWD